MKVLIKQVIPAAISKETSKVYSWTIFGILETGKKIKIKDLLPFDLRKYIDQEVECLIAATFIKVFDKCNESEKEDIGAPILTGKYIQNYKIPKNWEKSKDYLLDLEESYAVQTKEGIFLIDPQDFVRQGISIKVGDKFVFKAADLELEAWRLLK